MEDISTLSRIDRCSAHFGFPGGCRFYTPVLGKNSLRVFKSNPVKGANGIWNARRGSLDISLGVSRGLKSLVLEILAEGFKENGSV